MDSAWAWWREQNLNKISISLKVDGRIPAGNRLTIVSQSSVPGVLPMTRSVIHTDKAPKAIGPYSQAVRAGNTVWLSGQIPLDPETMELVQGDMRVQATRVFDNLKAVCEASGGNLDNIVKLSIFLTDLQHFSLINELMQQYFSEPYPARAAIGVASLPKGADVEMEAILVLPEA